MKGLVFDIKRFAVHDGPGIRTTVFLKGCPLACTWCQNPEGIAPFPRLWYFENKCIRCHSCLQACPNGALSVADGSIIIDRTRCTGHGACVTTCPTEALAFDSRRMELDEVVDDVLKDRLFFEVSGGGLTVSGGDPLYQHDFALRLLRRAREHSIHTVLETALYASRSTLAAFLPATDLFLVDIKLMDQDAHVRYTGTGNDPVLGNLRYLASREAGILVRIPLIPGVTATGDNVRSIARFVRSLSPEIAIELVNFNPLAADKYRILGKPYPFARYTAPLPDATLDGFRDIIMQEGVAVAPEQQEHTPARPQ